MTTKYHQTYAVLLLLLCVSSEVFGFSSVSKPQTAVPPTQESSPHHLEFPEADALQPEALSLELWQLALAGSLATLVSDSAMHPVDCIKTLLQSDQGMGSSSGMLGGVVYLWQTYGLAGFYKGLGAYATSDAIGGALKFATFESLQQYVQPRVSTKQQQYIASFLCAAVAFVVSSTIIVPGELLKQQLQMGLHSDLREAASSIYRSQGVMGFFCGYDGVCLRDIPYTMIELGLYDLLKKSSESSQQNDGNDGSFWTSRLEPWQRDIAAAAVTGGVAAFVTTPLDTIKTKVMVNSYANFYDCLVTTVHNHGALSVFAGADARVAWLVPFTAIYLPLYDFIKRQMEKQQ